MSVMLRPARPTDAGVLGAILSAFVDDTPWMPRIHSRAEDIAHVGILIERGWVTLAQSGDEVLGFLARDDDNVHALYVQPKARRMGVGKALLADAKSSAARLELWTFQANAGAQRFYRREGFAEVERTDGSANDEGLPDVRLVWTADAASPRQSTGAKP